MTDKANSSPWPLVFSTVLLTLGLTGLWQDVESRSLENRAVADTLPILAEWELGGGIADSSDGRLENSSGAISLKSSVTGPVSMPFDERAEERRHILRELENRSATLTRKLRQEWKVSRQDFEDRMEGLLDSSSHVAVDVPRRASGVSTPEAAMSQSKSKVEQMVYPIVQMKGTGTVGRGVVVFNEPSPAGLWYTWVVTAYHVVEEVRDFSDFDRTIVDVHFFDPDLGRVSEETYQGLEVVAYPEADLSLLRIEREQPWPYLAEVASEKVCSQLSVFDSVYAVGCPLGNQPIPTRGEISSQYKKVGDEVYWMVSAPTFFGNSGGGIFLSGSGQLVGISSMIYTYGKRAPMVVPHMGLFVPLAHVRSWLRREGLSHLLGTSTGTPVSASGVDIEGIGEDSGSF